jgi:N-acetylmuramoyl-L-alanine amidase
MAAVELLVLHHTASPATWTPQDVRRAHVDGRGWRDIGYHELVMCPDPSGPARVAVGRPYDLNDTWEPWEVGAHVEGSNARSWGCALVGNFDVAAPPAQQVDAAVALFAVQCLRWGLDPMTAIRGHREVAGARTVCPGRHIDLDAFRRRVAGLARIR